jgi:hypothetical protein
MRYIPKGKGFDNHCRGQLLYSQQTHPRENVTTDMLQRIYKALEVDIGDIMEVMPDEE